MEEQECLCQQEKQVLTSLQDRVIYPIVVTPLYSSPQLQEPAELALSISSTQS